MKHTPACAGNSSRPFQVHIVVCAAPESALHGAAWSADKPKLSQGLDITSAEGIATDGPVATAYLVNLAPGDAAHALAFD